MGGPFNQKTTGYILPIGHQQNIQHELLQQLHSLGPLSEVKERGILYGVCGVLHVIQSGNQQVHEAGGGKRKGA